MGTNLRGGLHVTGESSFATLTAIFNKATIGFEGPMKAKRAAIGNGLDFTNASQHYGVYVLSALAASKTVTLGLGEDLAAVVYNSGVNAFTLKNISGDTGVSVAAGKAYLVIGGGSTANSAAFILLNDGDGT